MKKRFLLCICICLLLCGLLAACGKQAPAEGSAESVTENSPEESVSAPSEGELLRQELFDDVYALAEWREVDGNGRTYWVAPEAAKALRAYGSACLTEEDVLTFAQRIAARFLSEGWRYVPFSLPGIDGNGEVSLSVWLDDPSADDLNRPYSTLLAYTLDLLTPQTYRFSALEVLGQETVTAMDSIWPETAWYLALGSYESREQALEGVRRGDRAVLLQGYADPEGKWSFDGDSFAGTVELIGGEETVRLTLREMYFRATGEDVDTVLSEGRE